MQALLVTLATATGSTGELPWRFFLLWWAVGDERVRHGARRGGAGRWPGPAFGPAGDPPRAGGRGATGRAVHPRSPAVRSGGGDRRHLRRSAQPRAGQCRRCPVLGSLDELASFVRAQPVDQVVITLPQHAANRRLACLERLRHLPIDVRLSPDLPGLEFNGRGTAELGGMPLLRVFDRPLAGSAWLAKAIEDRVLAATVLVLAAPMMLVLAGLVRIGSPGPVLYRQRRYGFDNRPIEVLKFRTMTSTTDADSAGQAVSAPPRPARHPDRPLPAPDQPRRAAAIPQRAARRDVPGRARGRTPWPTTSAMPADRRLPRPPPGQARHHRLGAGQRPARRGRHAGADAGARALRPLLIENWSLLLDLRIILRTLLVGFSHPNAY